MAARPPRRAPDQRPTLIVLVRHGQTSTTGKVLPGRAAGLHLSDAGRAQAEATAARVAALGRTRVAAVYASPLERTQETAAPIAAAVGKKVRVHDGLLECDFGSWTGKRLGDLRRRKEWGTIQRSPSRFRFPGGESFLEMQTRILEALDDLHRRHPGKIVVGVSHADPIRAAMSHAAGAHLDEFQRVVVSPCSVSALLVGPGPPVVLSVNNTGDLTALSPA